jgi:thioredoxin reductase
MFAAQLTQWSSDVTLCTNTIPRSDQDDVLRKRGVRIRTEAVQGVEGRDRSVERVVFRQGPPLPCAALFLHTTTRQASPLAERLHCAMLDDGSVRVDDEGRTSVPGVYAVGDMARRESSPSGITFVVTSMAMGFVTATAVHQELFTESLD